MNTNKPGGQKVYVFFLVLRGSQRLLGSAWHAEHAKGLYCETKEAHEVYDKRYQGFAVSAPHA
eukprot:506110-Amphidinium_carterae.1